MPPPADEPWTIRRLLTWTADFLAKKGSDSPRLDAEVLLASVLDWPRVKLYTHYDDLAEDGPRAKFRDLVRRRGEGAPVAYLVGRKEFYSLTFHVTPAVLIPRPDSEFVVVEFLAATKGRGPVRCVDVGTGSGCLALSCAHHNPSATFVGVDISPEAVAVAEANAVRLGLNGRASFRRGDRLDPVADEAPFDAIVSNPPYVRSGDIPGLEAGVRLFEPHLALDGGSDGLRVVAPLIAAAVGRLKPGGHLILEIGSDQEQQIRDLIAAERELDLAATVRDHANHPRVIRATRRS